MSYFYILKSLKTNRYYIGSTKDIEKRLKKHNSGSVHSTKAYRPWKSVFKEKYLTISEAKRREYQVKLWKSRYNIEKLIKETGPIV